MKTKLLSVLILLFTTTMFLGVPSANANGLTIGNGVIVTLSDTAINMGCLNISIDNGGTLDLDNGTITRCKHLYVESGGFFIPGNGHIFYCSAFIPGLLLILQ